MGRQKIDTSLLNKFIRRSGFMKVYLAEKLGITSVSLSAKINNKSQFKADEMYTLKKLLGLGDSEFMAIFFDGNVDYKSTGVKHGTQNT